MSWLKTAGATAGALAAGLLAPISLPLAAVVAAGTAVAAAVSDGDDNSPSSEELQSEAAEQAQQEAKKQAAAKERKNIVNFAKERLRELQKVYRPSLSTDIQYQFPDEIVTERNRSFFMALPLIAGFEIAKYSKMQLTFPKLRNAVSGNSSAAKIVDGLLPPLAKNVEAEILNQEIIEMKELCSILQSMEKAV